MNSWQEISTRLNQPVEQCKQKWKSLRKCYRKAMKKRETKSGQAHIKIKPWRLELQMEFVRPFVNIQRDQESNISEEEIAIAREKNSEEHVNNTPNQNTEESSEAEERRPTEDVGSAASEDQHQNIKESEQATNSDKRGLKSLNKIPFNGGSSFVGWKKPKTMTPAAAIFQDYVNFTKQQLNVKPIQTFVPHADHLTKYFQGVEETMRTLPKEIQIRVKSKIFQIVHDAELEAITRPPPLLQNIDYNQQCSASSSISVPPTPQKHAFEISQQTSTPFLQIREYQRTQEEAQFSAKQISSGSSSYSSTNLSSPAVSTFQMSPEDYNNNVILEL